MNEVDASVHPNSGAKRPVEDALTSPSLQKKKKSKLDPAAQSLLTEIFALQDTLSENEIEALARKVKGTRTQVVNFFNSWKTSVNILVEKSKNKAEGFHTKVVITQQPAPAAGPEIIEAQPPNSTTTTATTITTASPTVVKHETIPKSRVESERFALQFVATATGARHNAAATLAPYLDSQGGVKDLHNAVNTSSYAQMTTHLHHPTFTGQIQLCDALIATTNRDAFGFLSDNANIASALQAIVSRGVKTKQITLVVRAFHAMAHLGGFKKGVLNHKMKQLLRVISTGDGSSRSIVESGALHPAVKEAAMKLLALYPDDFLKVEHAVEENREVAAPPLPPPPQQQQQQVEEEEDKAERPPFESAVPFAGAIGDRKEENELATALTTEEKEAPAPEAAATIILPNTTKEPEEDLAAVLNPKTFTDGDNDGELTLGIDFLVEGNADFQQPAAALLAKETLALASAPLETLSINTDIDMQENQALDTPFELSTIEDERIRRTVKRISLQPLIDFGDDVVVENESSVYIRWTHAVRESCPTMHAILGLANSSNRGIGDAPSHYYRGLRHCAQGVYRHIQINIAPPDDSIELSLDFAAPPNSPEYLKAIMPIVSRPPNRKITKFTANVAPFYSLDDETKRQRRFEFLTLLCYSEGELPLEAQEGAVANVTYWINGEKTTAAIEIPEYIPGEKEPSPELERTTQCGKVVPNYKCFYRHV
jgi:hypothetical protein